MSTDTDLRTENYQVVRDLTSQVEPWMVQDISRDFADTIRKVGVYSHRTQDAAIAAMHAAEATHADRLAQHRAAQAAAVARREAEAAEKAAAAQAAEETAAVSAAAGPDAAPRLATPRQVDYLMSLLARRRFTGVPAELEDATTADLRTMTRGQISTWIDTVREQW